MRSSLSLAFMLLLLAGAHAVAQTETWRVYNTTNSGLPDDHVYALAFQGDVTWIGTASGLARLDETGWSVYDTLNSPLPNDHITALATGRDGALWIGTAYGGAARFDGTDWSLYNKENAALRNNTVHAIAIDSAGRPWITTDGGLAALRADGGWDLYHDENSGIGIPYARGIAIAHDGTKWLGLFDLFKLVGRLARFDDVSDTWSRYRLDEGGSVSPEAVAADRHDAVWVSTGLGLGRFKDSAWTMYNHANSGMPAAGVMAIALEGDVKWLGTGGGLVRFDDAVWNVYRTENSGLPDNSVYAVALDPSGDVWAGTGGGGVAALHRASASDVPVPGQAAGGIILSESYPHPVAASATISYRLDAAADVRLTLHDMQGRQIATLARGFRQSGPHDVVLDASSLPAGVYLCRLAAGRQSLSRMIVVAR